MVQCGFEHGAVVTTEADWRREEDGDTDPEEHSDSEFIVTGDSAYPMCVARNDMPERMNVLCHIVHRCTAMRNVTHILRIATLR